MGMNCSRCDILQSEPQNEVTRNSIKIRNEKQISYISFDFSSYSKEEKKIVTLQRHIRHFLSQNSSNRSHMPNISLQKLEQGEMVTRSKNEDYSSPNKPKSNYVENYQINDYAVYTGDIVNGIPNGKGTQIWKDGAKYEGEWKNGKANGYGMKV